MRLFEMRGRYENPVTVELPEWDEENQRPQTKMPDCPICGEDELGLLSKDLAFCYRCAVSFYRKEQKPSVQS